MTRFECLASALLLALPACFPQKPDQGDTQPAQPVDTDPDTDGDTDTAFHGEGWILGDAHGLAAKLQEHECTSCHGEDLLGGTTGPSCDDCHNESWRTDCTYCHGGMDDVTGAPPVDMDGLGSDLSFPEHGVHVQETIHAAWGCAECHVRPDDVLSAGHLFVADATPGEAELSFVDGLSAEGAYAGSGSCGDLYCHGDGGGNLGDWETSWSTDCASCHGGPDAPGGLTGVHAEHLEEGLECEDCHAQVASGSEDIADPELHVDGHVDVELASEDMSWDGGAGSCTGSCHGVPHGESTWGGLYHGTAWADPDAHAWAAKSQSMVCTNCHGEDLAGGSASTTCDECHEEGWRTDCDRCHGGADNATGAPPEDIDGSIGTISFPEHGRHVEENVHVAWDCDQCHVNPADVLSEGHVFVGDSTPAQAETDLSAGLSPEGGYDGAGSCGDLYCHGDGAGNTGSGTSGDLLNCGDCHGGQASTGLLSGVHDAHLAEGEDCESCHELTAAGSTGIGMPEYHVNGTVEVQLVSGMSWDGKASCTGSCHGTDHDGSTWDGIFHGGSWSDPVGHGLAAKLQDQDCANCHGTDLTGGTASTGCDDCHDPGWEADCTYCHGGLDNSTGAPPVDIDGSAIGLSFDAHGDHVEDTAWHVAWDCDQCHALPTDALDSGHLFISDTTAAVAEVDLSAGLSDAGTYGSGSCADLYCHGDGAGTLGSASTSGSVACGDCHGKATTADTLSGIHEVHVDGGADCDDCHADTASGSTGFSDVSQHVDGEIDIALTTGMTWDGVDTCSGTCHGDTHSGMTTSGGHASGYSAGSVHGLDYKEQAIDCTSCHGSGLSGGTSGQSCDDCHSSGWRSDCTFCHGGTDNATGAPPEDIDDSTTGITFPAHTDHVETTSWHAAWDCDQCHANHTSMLSPGHAHVSDSSAGTAEVDMSGGLSSSASYSGGGCSNLYCHGDGAGTLGSASTSGSVACGDCHGIATTASTLSATHDDHVDAGADCDDCHADTASGSTGFSDVSQHVDGEIDIALTTGMSWDSAGETCTGSCHGYTHSGMGFEGGHASGWDAAAVHGLAAKELDSDCTSCHGASLYGGTSGQGCDDCHPSGWRTDCTFCHGGTHNSTGAPPVDLDGTSSLPSMSFPAHTEHVERTDHPAWDCDTCHDLPTDVLTSGHLFVGDSTPAAAEVDMSGGLSSAGVYAATAGTCANLYCHGNGAGTLGTVSSGGTTNCSSCHGSSSSTSGMSGEHREHLHEGCACGDCHALTLSGSSSIGDPDYHVNGTVDVSMSGVSWTGSRCTGSCHGEGHSSESW